MADDRILCWIAAVTIGVWAGPVLAGQEWIRVDKDKRCFVTSPSGQRFIPWGVNYDRDEAGRLIEDYWDDEWATIEEDFQEMKDLGANVVRVHFQFARFMKTADVPDTHALDQLGRLVKLAERLGIYLDVTGLNCFHKQDVPAWYDALTEEARWEAQARFWRAVSDRCKDSPAIFCYDLMNEPVVAGNEARTEWLGGELGGKYYVQFITLHARNRPRPEIARAWINKLVGAIRERDPRHLITVGMVDWSLDRPGLSSGFVPQITGEQLDFIAVHIYPESGKLDEALDTLRGFNIGKPVVIEEMFPLKCSAEDLGRFINESRPFACGWIGFYWGRKPGEYTGATIGEAITLSWLKLFQEKGPAMRAAHCPTSATAPGPE